MLTGEFMDFNINIVNSIVTSHKHEDYEIIVYINGKGFFYADNKSIAVGPGQIIIVPPKTTHYSSKSDVDFERIYLSGPFHQFFSLTSPTVVFDNSRNDGLTLAKMIYTNRFSAPEYVTSLINAFSHFLLQNIKMENDIFLAVKNIVEEISDNFYNCNIDLNAILKKSGYSEDYIRAQFKKITAKTPVEFLTKTRIDHACYLIDQYKDLYSLSEIAEKCGYSDYVYFSRKFKQTIGISPREYMETN